MSEPKGNISHFPEHIPYLKETSLQYNQQTTSHLLYTYTRADSSDIMVEVCLFKEGLLKLQTEVGQIVVVVHGIGEKFAQRYLEFGLVSSCGISNIFERPSGDIMVMASGSYEIWAKQIISYLLL